MGRILHSRHEEENLCREVLKVQLAMGWPGLTKEVKEICRKVGLPDVTKEYLYRKKIYEYIQLYDMKVMKDNMHQDKYINIRNRDCRYVQSYMYEKNLLQSRTEFLWDTLMIDTRTTMKGKYQKDKYSCPTVGRAGRRECWRLPPTYSVSAPPTPI